MECGTSAEIRSNYSSDDWQRNEIDCTACLVLYRGNQRNKFSNKQSKRHWNEVDRFKLVKRHRNRRVALHMTDHLIGINNSLLFKRTRKRQRHRLTALKCLFIPHDLITCSTPTLCYWC